MKKISFYLFLTTLIFSPLAFGTVETWSYTIMESMICASAILLFLSRNQMPFYAVPGLIPLLVFSSLILFQIFPLPVSLVKLISPESYKIYYDAVGTITSMKWIPISIFPRATMMEFFRFSSYILFYITAVQLLSDRSLLKRTVTAVVWFGAILAFIVIIEFITRSLAYPVSQNKILWIRQSIQGTSSVGPYLNANHYAGLMEMIFPLSLSLFLLYQPVMPQKGLKENISALFLPQTIGRHYLYGLAAVLIASSIFVSLSKGGIVTLFFSVCFFSVLMFKKTNQKKTGGVVGFVFATVILLAASNSWDFILGEFGDIQNALASRLHRWTDSTRIINDFPLFGSGIGTFENIYPKYRTFPGDDILEFVHNDYIGFLCTGGAAIVVVMGFGLCVILFKSFRNYQKRHERYSIYLFMGCLTSVVSILLHSFVDFNMQIGANGLYFFFILALAVSSATTRLREERQASFLKISGIKRHIPVVAASLMCLGVLYINFGALIANYQFLNYGKISLGSDFSETTLKQIQKSSNRATMFDPLNPKYLYAAATAGVLVNQPKRAFNNYVKTLQREPLNSRYLQEAGYFLSLQGDKKSADKLMQTAIINDGRNMKAYLTYAVWLIEQDRVEKAFKVLKSAIAKEPKISKACFALVNFFGLDENRLKSAQPDKSDPFFSQ